MKKEYTIKYKTPTNKEKTLYLLIDVFISAFIAIPISFFVNKTFIFLISSSLPIGFDFNDIVNQAPFIISFIYFFAFITSLFLAIGLSSLFVGYTLGSRIYNVELIDIEYNESAPHNLRIKRGIITILDMIFLLGLGSFSSIFNKEGRTMADRFSGTKIAIRKRIPIKK